MEIEVWKKLLGKSQDEPEVKAALSAAGVKKAPKLARDETSAIVDLKGHGMWLKMTDEADFKKLDDQGIGEGPLILTRVGAYFSRRNSRDLYKDKLPHNIRAHMTRAEIRKTLGRPDSTDDDPPAADGWMRDGLEILVVYTKDSKMAHFNFILPPK